MTRPESRAGAVPTLRTLAAALGLAGCADLASQPDRVPRHLEVLPADTSVLAGESVAYRLRVLDEDGVAFDRIPSWVPPSWSVSDPVTAAVSGDGEVIALEAGREARIEAGLAELNGGARLRVNPPGVRIAAAAVHLTQAVQTLDGSVPLIAGRAGLLRLFLIGDRPSFFRPRPLATFRLDGEVIHTLRLDPPQDLLPVEIEEGRGDRSFNGEVPGWVLQPGVEYAVELDPDGVVPTLPGSDRRIPAEGLLPLDVREVPPLDLKIVPVLHGGGDGAVLTWVDGITATGPKMMFIRSILPVGELELAIREPYHTSADLTTKRGWLELLRELDLLRLIEGARGYYYGAVARPAGSPWGGLGYIGRPTSVGHINLNTFAHELGHNMGLRHAPCGGANAPDPNFPYGDGSIGAFGYETRSGVRRIVGPNEYRDLMTYCDPSWISDYHFMKALDFRRLRDPLTPTDAARQPTDAAQRATGAAGHPTDAAQRVLILWGSVGGKELLIEPAFVVEAPPRPPRGEGPYRIAGLDAAGRSLFDLSFAPSEVEFGGAQFAFAIPYEPGWAGAAGLDRIRLSGPEGSVLLPRSGGRRAALVTDPATGRLRGILRGATTIPAWAVGLDIAESDGVPDGPSAGRRE